MNASEPTELSIQINHVFEHWKVRFGHPKAKLDAKRRRAIRQRLLDGYSTDDLVSACEGCAITPHNMGQNDRNTVYDDIELICRDASHVDRFMATHERETKRREQAAAQRRAREAYEERKLAELSRAGRGHLRVAQ